MKPSIHLVMMNKDLAALGPLPILNKIMMKVLPFAALRFTIIFGQS